MIGRALNSIRGRGRALSWSLRKPNRRLRLAQWRQGRGLARDWRGRGVLAIALVEHMGDIAACEPVARFLKQENPGREIAWVVRPAYRELVAHHPDITHVIEVDTLSAWMALRPAFPDAVDLHVHERWCDPTGNTLFKPNGGHGVRRENYYFHGSLLAACCKGAGLPSLTDGPRVYPSDGDRRFIDALDLPPRFIVMHCRSNQASRDWRDEAWRELAAKLDVPTVEVGLDGVIGGEASRLCGRLSVLRTAEVIRRASLFVGIDSGPAHLANAAGTPGVILLGKYDCYDRYLPYSGGYGDGSNADIIHHAGPAGDIPFVDVVELCARRLAARAAP